MWQWQWHKSLETTGLSYLSLMMNINHILFMWFCLTTESVIVKQLRMWTELIKTLWEEEHLFC